MKINNVRINNCNSPSEQWWKLVEADPTEPLIEVTVTMTLSHTEYHALLAQDTRSLEAANGDVAKRL